MSKKKHVWSPTQSRRRKVHNSYTHNYKNKGKGKTCIYFNEEKLTCDYLCDMKIKQFCKNAKGCPHYIKKKILSPYDDTFIEKPMQEFYHCPTNEYISLSKNIGTPCHPEYLKIGENDKRRDKRRCIYYEKLHKLCSLKEFVCPGSSHCEEYNEP